MTLDEVLDLIRSTHAALSASGALEYLQGAGIVLAVAATAITTCAAVHKVTVFGWRAARWTASKARSAATASYRFVFPLPEEPEPLSLACSQILDALQDECAMYSPGQALLECTSLGGTIKVQFSLTGASINTIVKEADPGYDVLKDLNDRERDMVKDAADRAVARVVERDRQTRLANFAATSSYAPTVTTALRKLA